MLDRAVVINATAGIISEVKVRHEPTGKIGAVNMILPQKSLDLGFPRQPMRGRQGIVTWFDHNGHQRRAKVELPADRGSFSEGQAKSLVYTIEPAGVVHVHLEHLKR